MNQFVNENLSPFRVFQLSLAGLMLAGVCLLPDRMAVAQSTDRDGAYTALAREADLIEREYSLLKKVVKVAQPSVVHIEAHKTSRGTNNALTQVEEAGAGVVMKYGERFFVITNRHVIVDAPIDSIRIQLADGRFFNPIEVRTDPDSDIALMYLAETDLEPARFGNSDKMEIGDFVVAVGSPFGLSHSVSYGIISARGAAIWNWVLKASSFRISCKPMPPSIRATVADHC